MLLGALRLVRFLLVVIRGFYVHNFVVNDMTLALVDIKQYLLHFHSLVAIFELHLDETESTAPLCLPVSHDNRVGYSAVLLKIVDQIRL